MNKFLKWLEWVRLNRREADYDAILTEQLHRNMDDMNMRLMEKCVLKLYPDTMENDFPRMDEVWSNLQAEMERVKQEEQTKRELLKKR